MRILPYDQLHLAKGISYSRVHLGRLERAGRFPKRIQISPGRVAWLESEIDAWLKERAAARSGGSAQ